MTKPDIVSYSKKKAAIAFWNRGSLSYKLRPEQKILYNKIRTAKGLKYTLYCSRRFGKSFVARIIAIEDCLRNPGWEIGFIAPTSLALNRIYGPMDDEIFKDAPEGMRPSYKREMSAFKFTNGSWLFQSGTENKRYEGLRGLNLHRCYYDEPGSFSDLKIIVGSIIQPMCMTTTAARKDSCAQIFLGTPPSTPGHDYFFIKEECKAIGNFHKATIDDNSSISEKTKKQFIDECQTQDEVDREYYCKDVTNTQFAICPEFTEDKADLLTREFDRPQYYELYGSCDPAFNDFTAYLLGYYDFHKARYYIEGELLINKSNSQEIAIAINELEKELFPKKHVYERVCDTDPQFICDMRELHNIDFTPTAKDNKEQAINYMRGLIYKEELFIHPRCVNLIRQLRAGTWKPTRKSFVRTDLDGHYDLIDSLVYMLRNMDRYTMPGPDPYDLLDQANMHIGYRRKQNAFVDIFC